MKSTRPQLRNISFAVLTLAATQSIHAQIYDISAGNGYNIYETPATGGASSLFATVPGYSYSLALSGNDLFVGEVSPNNVIEYNATTGVQNTNFNISASDPVGLAVSGLTLYVDNRGNAAGNGSISAYNINTGVGTTIISNLAQPQALASYNGNLYVGLNNGGLTGAGSIEEFDALGDQIGTFSVTGLSNPEGITFSNGNLYVTDEGSTTVGEYNATTGAAINASLITGINNPYGISTLANGNLVIASESPQGPVYEYDPNGNLLSSSYVTGPGVQYATGIVATPEPQAWVLLLAGMAALVVLTRKRLHV